MSSYEIPTLGTVTVVIDRQGFFQSGVALKTLDRAYRADGSLITGDEQQVVEAYLMKIGAINQ